MIWRVLKQLPVKSRFGLNHSRALRYFFLVYFASNLSACVSSLERSSGALRPETRPAPQLLDAQSKLNERAYSSAFALSDAYLKSHSGPNRNVIIATFLRGQASEGAEQFKAAIHDYRAALALVSGDEDPDQAILLYRLLNCYEGVGETANSLATLHDLELRANQLPDEVASLEIPARYAMIFTRRGEQRQAEEYFKVFSTRLSQYRTLHEGTVAAAETQGKKLKLAPTTTTSILGTFAQHYGQSFADQQVLLPRLLYHVGKLSMRPATIEELRTGYAALAHSQVYLYQAATDISPTPSTEWQKLAVDELYEIYQSALETIQNIPAVETADPLIGLVERQRLQKKLAALTLVRLNELHGMHEADQSRNTDELFTRLAPVEATLTTIVAARPINEHLTPESERRQGIFRKNVKSK
jgi:hypothetical protein